MQSSEIAIIDFNLSQIEFQILRNKFCAIVGIGNSVSKFTNNEKKKKSVLQSAVKYLETHFYCNNINTI